MRKSSFEISAQSQQNQKVSILLQEIFIHQKIAVNKRNTEVKRKIHTNKQARIQKIMLNARLMLCQLSDHLIFVKRRGHHACKAST